MCVIHTDAGKNPCVQRTVWVPCSLGAPVGCGSGHMVREGEKILQARLLSGCCEVFKLQHQLLFTVI